VCCCHLARPMHMALQERAHHACRTSIQLHITCFICELGVVVITLLNLISDSTSAAMHDNDGLQMSSSANIRMTVASLALTLTTFSLTMLDTAAIIERMKAAVKSSAERARESISRISARRGQSCLSSVHPGSSPGEAHPEQGDTDGEHEDAIGA
jgi:hypothetical protein